MSVVLSGPDVASTFTELPVAGRVLLAGDDSSIDALRAVVATLGERARGQIFIEVETASQIVPIDVPELVTVAWLTRASRSGAPGTCEPCRPGVALSRAVRAWVSEMHTGDADLDGGELTAYVDGAGLEIADLRSDLILRLGSIRHPGTVAA